MSANAQRFESHPIELIRSAVLWIRAAKIPVHLGRLGVRCVSKRPREPWEKEPDARFIDPLGSVLLHAQPPAADDPHEALAEALFAPVEWVRAFAAGLELQAMPDEWITALDHRVRISAYEQGLRYREEFLTFRSGSVLA
jgi:hypothetical protein